MARKHLQKRVEIEPTIKRKKLSKSFDLLLKFTKKYLLNHKQTVSAEYVLALFLIKDGQNTILAIRDALGRDTSNGCYAPLKGLVEQKLVKVTKSIGAGGYEVNKYELTAKGKKVPFLDDDSVRRFLLFLNSKNTKKANVSLNMRSLYIILCMYVEWHITCQGLNDQMEGTPVYVWASSMTLLYERGVVNYFQKEGDKKTKYWHLTPDVINSIK